MESVQDTKQKGIIIFHQGIKQDKKGAVHVRYLSTGTKMHIVHAVTIN